MRTISYFALLLHELKCPLEPILASKIRVPATGDEVMVQILLIKILLDSF
jgi:hypothetical protein